MNLNIRRLRSAVNWVKGQAALPKKRRRWDQSSWFRLTEKAEACRTACCVAGYLVTEFGRDQFEVRQVGSAFWMGSPLFEPFRKGTDVQVGWDVAAAEVLGLRPAGDYALGDWDYDEDRSPQEWEYILDNLFEEANGPEQIEQDAERLAAYFGKTL